MELEKPMTPEEVAAEMRVTTGTVWRWCRDGLGSKYGRTYRITRSDLEQWGKNSAEKVSA